MFALHEYKENCLYFPIEQMAQKVRSTCRLWNRLFREAMRDDAYFWRAVLAQTFCVYRVTSELQVLSEDRKSVAAPYAHIADHQHFQTTLKDQEPSVFCCADSRVNFYPYLTYRHQRTVHENKVEICLWKIWNQWSNNQHSGPWSPYSILGNKLYCPKTMGNTVVFIASKRHDDEATKLYMASWWGNNCVPDTIAKIPFPLRDLCDGPLYLSLYEGVPRAVLKVPGNRVYDTLRSGFLDLKNNHSVLNIDSSGNTILFVQQAPNGGCLCANTCRTCISEAGQRIVLEESVVATECPLQGIQDTVPVCTCMVTPHDNAVSGQGGTTFIWLFVAHYPPHDPNGKPCTYTVQAVSLQAGVLQNVFCTEMSDATGPVVGAVLVDGTTMQKWEKGKVPNTNFLVQTLTDPYIRQLGNQHTFRKFYKPSNNGTLAHVRVYPNACTKRVYVISARGGQEQKPILCRVGSLNIVSQTTNEEGDVILCIRACNVNDHAILMHVKVDPRFIPPEMPY